MLLALATAARAQGAPTQPAAIPTDLIGNFVSPPDRSDQVFNRHGLQAIYQLVYRRPLLVVSWRADDPASLERAVPAALELKERFGDDLALLCVERSGRPFADMLRVVCARRWLCPDALWTCEVPAGLEVMPSPSFVLTSLEHRGVLVGDLVADREKLEAAIGEVVEERRLGAADLPEEARAAWKACAEGKWPAALKLRRAAEKRRARGQPGDAQAADVLDKQAALVDDVLMNEVQIAEGMTHSGAAVEGRLHADAYWKLVKDLPPEDRLRRTVESLYDSVHHETLLAELEASEALEVLQDKLCRNGPSASLAASLRKLAKEHAGTKGAERALAYAAMIGEG